MQCERLSRAKFISRDVSETKDEYVGVLKKCYRDQWNAKSGSFGDRG